MIARGEGGGTRSEIAVPRGIWLHNWTMTAVPGCVSGLVHNPAWDKGPLQCWGFEQFYGATLKDPFSAVLAKTC